MTVRAPFSPRDEKRSGVCIHESKRKGVAMTNSSEAVKEAIAMQAEAAEDVEAAEVEQRRGAASLSIDLLIDAVRKEREGLDKLEQGIDVLRESLEERRRALDRQGEILEQLVNRV
jgi:hypothetical protein